MNTVTLLPAPAAVACLQHAPTMLTGLPSAAVKLGERVEIDVSKTGSKIAKVLEAYAKQLQTDNGTYFQVDTVMYHDVQRCGPGAKEDLDKDLQTLTDWTVTAHLIDALLGGDEQVAAEEAALAGWEVKKVNGGLEVIYVDEGKGWPNLYGGSGALRETQRKLVINTRYASWRDRKRRRLSSVKVISTSVWPAPKVLVK